MSLFHYVLVADPDLVSSDALESMCEAFDEVLTPWAQTWGFDGVLGECITGASAHNDADFVVSFTTKDAVPGALAYHDESGDVPYAHVLVDVIRAYGGADLTGAEGLSVAASHEIAEALADLFCSTWCLLPSGVEFLAQEVSDPVQGAIVRASNGVDVADAVYPRYFDPQAVKGPFDIAGIVERPFQLTSGGYQIVYDVPRGGKIKQVFGEEMPEHVRAYRSREGSRAARRVARSPAAPTLASPAAAAPAAPSPFAPRPYQPFARKA